AARPGRPAGPRLPRRPQAGPEARSGRPRREEPAARRHRPLRLTGRYAGGMPDPAPDLPALLGGTPVRPEGPPPWPPPDPDVQAALAAAFASGDWGKYHGEHVSAL